MRWYAFRAGGDFRPSSQRGGAIGGSNGSSSWFGGGFVTGTVGGDVMTETSNGTTVQYRDDTAARVAITDVFVNFVFSRWSSSTTKHTKSTKGSKATSG